MSKLNVNDLPLLKEDDPAIILSAEVYNAIVLSVRAFYNLRAAPGSGLRVIHTDDGIVIDQDEQ